METSSSIAPAVLYINSKNYSANPLMDVICKLILINFLFLLLRQSQMQFIQANFLWGQLYFIYYATKDCDAKMETSSFIAPAVLYLNSKNYSANALMDVICKLKLINFLFLLLRQSIHTREFSFGPTERNQDPTTGSTDNLPRYIYLTIGKLIRE